MGSLSATSRAASGYANSRARALAKDEILGAEGHHVVSGRVASRAKSTKTKGRSRCGFCSFLNLSQFFPCRSSSRFSQVRSSWRWRAPDRIVGARMKPEARAVCDWFRSKEWILVAEADRLQAIGGHTASCRMTVVGFVVEHGRCSCRGHGRGVKQRVVGPGGPSCSPRAPRVSRRDVGHRPNRRCQVVGRAPRVGSQEERNSFFPRPRRLLSGDHVPGRWRCHCRPLRRLRTPTPVRQLGGVEPAQVAASRRKWRGVGDERLAPERAIQRLVIALVRLGGRRTALFKVRRRRLDDAYRRGQC